MDVGIPKFLEAMFGNAPINKPWGPGSICRHVSVFTLPNMEVARFPGSPALSGEPRQWRERVAAYAGRQSPFQDVYFGLGLIGGDPPGRGKASDVVGIGALWCDIDVAGPAHKNAKLPATIEEAHSILSAMPLAPSCIVHSGHGLHAYWYLAEPWLFEDDVDRRAAADLAKGWHELVCRKAKAKGWVLENLGDLAHVLRLPNTLNHKIKPVPVEVLTIVPDRRYERCDFEPFIPDEAAKHFLPVGPAAVAPAGLSLILQADAEPPSQKLIEACEKSGAFRRSWAGKNGRLDDQSPSGYDLSLASLAVAAGWTDQEVAHLIIAFRRGQGDVEKALRPDYMQRTIAKAHEQAGGKRDKEKSRADVLLDLVRAADLWHAGDWPFATFERNGHREHRLVRSGEFKEWLRHQYYKATTHGTSSSAIQDAIDTAAAIALFEGKEHTVAIRLGEHKGDIYLDLCNDDWQAVRITRAGWSVVDATPNQLRFRRAHGMKSLPVPMRVDCHKLRSLLNVTDGGWMLVAAWLLAAMRPTGPYPILCLLGEPGCAKSTIARVLRSLVDPNVAPIRRQPETSRDLAITAENSWILAFDNLSRITNDLSDALCRMATGGGFATRALYQDTGETILDASRPVILTGTQELATRGDLMERCLTVELPIISDRERLTEQEFNARFEELRAGILGAVCSAVSTALFNLPQVNLASLPRMADFAIWATAGLPGLGVSPGAFLAAYNESLASGNQVALEASPLGEIFARIIDDPEYSDGTLTGTSAEILRGLNASAPEELKKQRGWPQNARSLSAAVRRIAGNLRREGIVVKRWRESGTGRRIMSIERESK